MTITKRNRTTTNNRRGTCIVNGTFYVDGMGCAEFPSCFACGHECDYKNGAWKGEYPKCLNPFNCLECVTKKCREVVP